MERTTYTSPLTTHLSMSKSSTAKSVQLYIWATGYGPAGYFPADSIGVVNTAGNITVEVDPTSTGASWGPYNGLIGEEPELAGGPVSVEISVTNPANEVTDGTITISGPVNAVIYIHAIVEDNLILDKFDDNNGTHLHDHTPDTCPGGSSWAGTLANYSITGNVLTLGCCSGNADAAYINASLDDGYIVYADITRKSGYAGTPKPGVIGRVKSTGVDYVKFMVDNDGATTCNLVWAHMEGVTNHGSGTIATGYAWARDTAKRMLLHFVGADVYFYIGTVDGSSYTFLTTKTLSPTFIGNGHTYTGLWATAVGGDTVFTKFATIQLALLVANNSLSFTGHLLGVPTSSQSVDIVQVPTGFPLGSITKEIHYLDGSGWLTSTLAGTNAPTSIEVSCNPTGLAEGVYHATITIDSTENDGDPQEIAIEFTIIDTVLSVDPTSVSMSITKV